MTVVRDWRVVLEGVAFDEHAASAKVVLLSIRPIGLAVFVPRVYFCPLSAVMLPREAHIDGVSGKISLVLFEVVVEDDDCWLHLCIVPGSHVLHVIEVDLRDIFFFAAGSYRLLLCYPQAVLGRVFEHWRVDRDGSAEHSHVALELIFSEVDRPLRLLDVNC